MSCRKGLRAMGSIHDSKFSRARNTCKKLIDANHGKYKADLLVNYCDLSTILVEIERLECLLLHRSSPVDE